MESLSGKITGQDLLAEEFVQPMSEIEGVIESTGQTLSDLDLNQLGKGIAGYVANGNFYTDSGIADAYVLTKIGSKQTATAYTDGLQAHFIVGNTNTGASTVNIAGLGAKNITGSESAGSMVSGEYRAIVYRESSGDFTLTPINSRSLSYTPVNAGAVEYDAQTRLRNEEWASDNAIDNTGVIDATAAMIEGNYTQSSEIRLGSGTFKMNKWMELNSIKGNGYSTELKPFSAVTNDGFILSLGAHSSPYGAFDFQWVRDLAMDGEAGGCIRFDDKDDVDGADLSSVGWLLENLALRSIGGGTCVKSEFGTIGNKFNNIAGYACDYHFWLQDNRFSVQHTGANSWNQNHLQRAEKASIYISDNQGGRGGWAINDSIIENNHGFGMFCISDTASPSISPLVLNNIWFEKNGLEATPLIPSHTVEIDSVTYTPRDMRFEKFGSVIVNGSHFKSIDIVESDVSANNCRHDGDQGLYSVAKDKNSTINLWNPSGANGFSSCDEWSHTAPASTVDYFANRQPMLRMAHRSVKAIATRRTSISLGFEKTISGNYTFGSGMTGAQATDGILHTTCLEATVTASQTSGSAIINETSASVGGLSGLTTPTVSGITQANPAVVSATAHGYVDNQLVNLADVVGMVELNDREYYIDKIDNDSFSLRGEDSTGHTAWSSGGTFAGISSYAVMTVAAKVMSGLGNLSSITWSNNGAGNVGPIRTGALEEWVTTVCLVKMIDTGIGFAAARLMVKTNSGGSAVIRFADYQVAAFPTKQEASDFIHSGIFEYTSGEELTITPDTVNDTAACSLLTEQSNLVTTGAATPTLADGFEGQIKTIFHKTFSGAATITPANMHGMASITTSAAGQSIVLKFTEGAWTLVGNPYGLGA